MYTYLEVLSGINKGMTYRVQPNVRVGSSDQCDIPLTDPEAPPLHSMVLLDQRDQLVLVCTNAVYEMRANDRTVKKTVLSDEKIIHIFSIELRVRVTQHPLIGAIDPFSLRQMPAELAPQAAPAENDAINDQSRVTQIETPKSKLLKELNSILESFNTPFPSAHAFKLFKQPILLKVESGPQADDEFLISWGPRDFGPQALEFQLEFPPFPAVLFTLTPDADGSVLFSTKHPNFASVSGQESENGVITNGTKIIAGNSTLSVEFVSDTKGVHG